MIRVDEGLRSDLPSQTRLRRERERERVPWGWPTEWVDEGGRTKLLRERVLGAGRMGKEGGALRLGLGFFLVFIYIYIYIYNVGRVG